MELFHQLSQALEVLTDAAAKVKPWTNIILCKCEQIQNMHIYTSLWFQAAYDKICAAKKQAEERNRKLDDKRKKIKMGEWLRELITFFFSAKHKKKKNTFKSVLTSVISHYRNFLHIKPFNKVQK